MKIVIQRGKPKRTEHGRAYFDKPTVVAVNHNFDCETKIHLTTIKFDKFIHPCNKESECSCQYCGEYYETECSG